MMKVTAYLALGSNLGDRQKRLLEAQEWLKTSLGIEVVKISKLYETEPWPKVEIEKGRSLEKIEQNWHLNQVVQIKTELSPELLLSTVQDIEKKMGKVQKPVWGSREIDIDILLYGDQVIDLPQLQIPHPFMNQRQFVLVPLLEIAPELKDPRTDKLFRDILEGIEGEYEINLFQ